jgi:hypothetical protein
MALSTPPGSDYNSPGQAQLDLQVKLWGTPTARDYKDSEGMSLTGTNPDGTTRQRNDQLGRQVMQWQTPAVDSFRSRSGDRKDEMGLDQQARYWPTPSAAVANDGETLESWDRRKAALLSKKINGNGIGTPLTIAAIRWPTPRASHNENRTTHDAPSHGTSHGRTLAGAAGSWVTPTVQQGKYQFAKGNHQHLSVTLAGQVDLWPNTDLSRQDLANWRGGQRSSKTTRKLNPLFVEWLMGMPQGWVSGGSINFASWEMASCLRLPQRRY